MTSVLLVFAISKTLVYLFTKLMQTHKTKLKKRLSQFTAKYPEHCRQTDDDEQGGLTFEIEKGRLSFRLTAPYSAERRKTYSKNAKEKGMMGSAKHQEQH